MYKLKTIRYVDNILNTALDEAEKYALNWLEKRNVDVVSISPTCIVDEHNPVGKYTYIITVAYKTENGE